jgi:hypothetical protein
LALPEGGLAEALRRASDPATERPPQEHSAAAANDSESNSLPRTVPGVPLARVALSGRVGAALPRTPAEPEEAATDVVGMDADGLDDDLDLEDMLGGASAAGSPESEALFALLWPPAELGRVRELEQALAQRDFPRVVNLADQLAAHTLASGASLMSGAHDAPRDPLLAAVLLGLQGREYMEFRTLVRKARVNGSVGHDEALRAYVFTLQARVALNRFGV